jgi:tetratricopeptide (TPR) repeat protein
LPFAVVSGLAALITVMSQSNAIQSSDVFPTHLRLGNVFIAYCRYLGGIFWPAELSIYYPIHWHSITPITVVGSILAIGFLSMWACWNAGRRPYLLTGWFWFLISMLPVIGIVHVGAQSMADRYLYNASLGIYLSIVWLAAEVLTAIQRKVLHKQSLLRQFQMASCALILVLFAAMALTTYRRCVRWQTELGPFYEAIDHDPTNWMAHLIVAEKLLEQGRHESAIEHTHAVTQEDSRFYVLHAFACRELGRSGEAMKLLKQAIELSPDNALALSMLAVIHAESDHATEARTLLELAEQKLKLPVNQLQPRTPPIVLRNCGITLLQLGRTQEAIQRFEAAVSLDHRNADLVRDLAGAELQVHLVDRAIDRVQELTATSPDDSASYSLLGLALKQAGRHVEAEQSLRRALELEPAQPQASLQLADILLRSGRIDEAEKALQDSLSLLHSITVTRDTQQWTGELNSQLGDVLLAKKDLSGAIGYYQAAIESTPDQFSANNNMAWLLATEPDPAIRDPEKAIRLAEHANNLPGGMDQGSLGTLAAAYAAAGRMDEAIRTAEQALAMAEAKGDAASAAQLRTQLELHRQGKPLIESVLKSAQDKAAED